MAYYVKKNGQLEKIAGNVSISQADWNETDDRKITKIKNKPETLNTLDAVVENSNENALVGANALKELTTTVAGMGSELIKTSAKVNLLANSDLGINVVEKGENIHLDDSADSKLVEFALYGKARQNTTTGKNLLDYSNGSTVKNGVEYTYNPDGSVTANGTASENSSYYKSITLEAGEYIMSGSPSGGTSNTYYISTNIGVGNDYGNGVKFTINDKTTFNLYCNVRNGYNAQNLKFYPMIRLASITDATYEPYTGGIPSPNPEYPQDIEVAGESYNLLENTATSQTINGVSFVVNEDKSVTLNGKATDVINSFYFSKKNMDLTGMIAACEGINSLSGIYFAVNNTENTTFNVYGNTKEAVLSGVMTYARLYINKDAVFNNVTIYPMIRKASVKNDRYMPYRKGSIEVKSVGKNLLKNNAASQTINGLTFTINEEDKSVSVIGNSTEDTAFILENTNELIKKLPKSGRIELSGCTDGSVNTYYVTMQIFHDDSEHAYFCYDRPINFSYNNIIPVDNRNIYILIKKGVEINTTFYPMLRFASDTDDTYEPYKEIISTIPTTDFAGIPVSSGGNYTDANGQQWICDEIVKYADGSGEYIQRVESVVFDGSSDEGWGISSASDKYRINTDKIKDLARKAGNNNQIANILCSQFVKSSPNQTYLKNDGITVGDNGRLYIYSNEYSTNDVSLWTSHLSENPMECLFELAEPIRTSLTAEQLAEIEKLSTFYPITNISNDADCGMKVKYIADNKAYVDKNLELQIKAQEQAMMSMFLLLPDEMQAAMISKDISNILLESEV